MNHERQLTFIIGLLVNSYWKEKNFIRQTAHDGDWAVEITTLSNTIHSENHDYKAQIMKVTAREDATYEGIRLDGIKQEWRGAMLYKLPADVQEILNTVFWDETTNNIKEIMLRDTSNEVTLIKVVAGET